MFRIKILGRTPIHACHTKAGCIRKASACFLHTSRVEKVPFSFFSYSLSVEPFEHAIQDREGSSWAGPRPHTVLPFSLPFARCYIKVNVVFVLTFKRNL